MKSFVLKLLVVLSVFFSFGCATTHETNSAWAPPFPPGPPPKPKEDEPPPDPPPPPPEPKPEPPK